jgi:glycosyltransferase involved in cell wall biosynthesis
VDVGLFRPLVHRDTGHAPYILCVGRLADPRKRVDLLLRAFAASRRRGETRLTIVGDGPMRSALEALAQELAVDDQVTFAGELAHTALRDQLGGAAIFVLPSDSEGMSNSLLEAMAQGLAVIVADIEANREIVEQGVSGLLFEDASGLSGHIDALIGDAGLRARLGANAREVVSRRQSFATIASQYDELYGSVVSERRRNS